MSMSDSRFPSAGESWFARVSLSCLCGVIGAVLVATLEWVKLEPSEPLALAASIGMLVPIGVLVGLAAGVASRLLQPGFDVGVLALKRLREADDATRRLAVGYALCGPPAALLWLVATGRAALLLLASAQTAAVVAAAAALSSVCLGVLAFGGAAWGARQLAPRLPSKHPVAAVGIAACVLLIGIGVLISVGNTGGSGTSWQLFGTLRRQELDVRAPAFLLLIGGIAYQLPVLLRRLSAPVALALALASLGFTVGAASWFEDAALRHGTERSTALSKTSLKLAQRLSDRDGDGFGALFGGGDCNDQNPAINPDANDIAGNQIDEDCLGGDAKPRQTERPPKESEPAAPSKQVPNDLNVLLITIDTLRWDLGYMGYERPITPNIDALAKRSVVLENAYALASYTSKSMGPMLIGRYGSETNRGWLHFNKYPEQDVMLQERLQQGGIHTVSVQAHWYFEPKYGLGRGFDVLDTSASPETPQKEGDRSVNSDKLTKAAIGQLEALQAKAQRFFMWVHYLDPHAEYVPHEEFSFGKKQRDLYDGEIAFTDHHVGKLLDALQNSPLAKNTAIILTSDHGEAFGEHGMIRHGFELWEELVRVPWIFYVPGIEPRRETVRRSHIDMTPTIMQMLDVDLPSGDDFLSGQSMLQDVLKPEGYVPAERPIFIDMQAGPYNTERQAWIEGPYKLVTSSSRPMSVFNLKEDPGETENLMKDTELTSKLLDSFKQFRSGLKRIHVKPQKR